MKSRGLTCSFCRRDEAAVAKLVAGPRMLGIGPRALICDRCVAAAQRLIEESGGEGPPSPALQV